MVRASKVVFPALLGLALSISALAGPPAQAAPLLTPAVVPAIAPPASPLQVDANAKLTVNPVAYGGSVVADFSKGQTVKKRPVMLQAKQLDGTWAKLFKRPFKMDSKGVVVFKLRIGDSTIYRAVAGRYKKKTEVVTPERWSAWSVQKSYEFTGPTLDADWAPRNEGSFAAYERNCAAPFASNVTLSKGNVHLALKLGSKADSDAAKLAGCVPSSKVKVYRNAMISTAGAYSLSSGIMAARVKFPKTRGLHNGVWLRSLNSEIDMVEAYGYPKGRGVTHAWHYYNPNKNCDPAVKAKVNPCRVIAEHKKIGNKSKKWWGQYHVYSVDWNSQRVTYRIDGAITKTVYPGSSYSSPVDESYFLVISSLTSEFDQRAHKITAKELASTKTSVDWVRVWATK